MDSRIDGLSAKPSTLHYVRCFKISAPILFFRREASQLYSLKSIQNILLTERKNQGNFREVKLTNFTIK